MRTDKERLDKLQELTKGYGGGWICRNSISGRGLRLYEASDNYLRHPFKDIREVIDHFLDCKGV